MENMRKGTIKPGKHGLHHSCRDIIKPIISSNAIRGRCQSLLKPFSVFILMIYLLGTS